LNLLSSNSRKTSMLTLAHFGDTLTARMTKIKIVRTSCGSPSSAARNSQLLPPLCSRIHSQLPATIGCGGSRWYLSKILVETMGSPREKNSITPQMRFSTTVIVNDGDCSYDIPYWGVRSCDATGCGKFVADAHTNLLRPCCMSRKKPEQTKVVSRRHNIIILLLKLRPRLVTRTEQVATRTGWMAKIAILLFCKVHIIRLCLGRGWG
jgi:hypothetical protein